MIEAIGFSAIVIGCIPSGQDHITYPRKSRESPKESS
jgi:hypothetical protein